MTNTLEINVPALKERVTNIIKTPKTEWPVIEAEATTTESLYKGYIVPLAAIPAVATFVGMSIVGTTLPFVGTFRVGIVSGIANMLVSYAFALVGVYVAALIVDRLAPTFESRPNQMQALKLGTYAQTPAWLAGIFFAVPVLSPLAILGLYSVYLFYLGVPVMMKTPETKVIPYMIVAAIVVIAVSFVMGILAAMLTGVSRF